MKYLSFEISGYRGITNPMIINLANNPLLPLIGINECGKTTILQAIYCFDETNDTGYDGMHLKNTLNLYQTDDEQEPLITATIEIAYSDLEKIVDEYNIEAKVKAKASEPTTEPNSFQKLTIPINRKGFSKKIRLERNLKTLKYRFNEEKFQSLNPIAKRIVRKMPFILYNDDFMDRPPNAVKIPSPIPSKLPEWVGIYNRLFNITNPKYSLFKLAVEEDARRKDSIISDVEEELNRRLSKAWRTFLLSKHGTINVRLKIVDNDEPEYPHLLEVKIVEKIGKKERHFNVVDRSKGFLWFFNFVMKLEFNPKVVGNKKDTIYLLDEPGSYLHSSAQEKLCVKLKDISEKNGNVIYCTHSHHLLNPEFIPINKIYVVEKEKDKNIRALPLTSYKPKKENTSAFQPLMDALQIPAFQFYNNDNPIIAAEGIYDKYVLELFVGIGFDFTVLPGVGAGSIARNIQFLNGFSKNYVAIWDNDVEGTKEYKKACKKFGEIEAERFSQLPRLGRHTRIMQQMFEGEELSRIRKNIGLSPDSDFEKTIATLYFSKPNKEKIKESLSEKTRENFSTLEKILIKLFIKSNEIRERSFR